MLTDMSELASDRAYNLFNLIRNINKTVTCCDPHLVPG